MLNLPADLLTWNHWRMAARTIAAAIAAIVAVGCGRSEPPVVPPPAGSSPASSPTQTGLAFVERTQTGVDFQYRNGTEERRYTILESLGGGVGLADYDRDGRLDICLAGGGGFGAAREIIGRPLGLFRNGGDWRFTPMATEARTDGPGPYSHGIAAADFDNDGFSDLLQTGYGGLRLWWNCGDGTFLEVATVAGLLNPSWSSSAAWGDVNGDGALDLYVAHYVNWSWDNDPPCTGPPPDGRDICPPRQYDGLDDRLFFSNGDGTFRNGTAEGGLVAGGKGLGVVCADLDQDADVDIYVANDTTENFLYLNDGQGRLAEVGVSRGVAYDDFAVANGSMGVDVCDFNGDGGLDLWVANYESEAFALYRNLGDARFLFATRETGVGAIEHLFVGFGTRAADLDLDGDEDLVVSNGHVILFPKNAPVRQRPLLLENQKGRFNAPDLSASRYFVEPHVGRGLATGDLDGDGDLDIVISHNNEPASLLENRSSGGGSGVQVELIGRRSNRDAIGAIARLRAGGTTQIRSRSGGGSYLSSSLAPLHWGIPVGTAVKSVEITWPTGAATERPVAGTGEVLRIFEE